MNINNLDTEGQQILLEENVINVKEINNYATSVQSDILKPIIKTFAKNISDISGMLHLPHILLTTGLAHSNALAKYAVLLRQREENQEELNQEEDETKIQELIDAEFDDPDIAASNLKTAGVLLNILIPEEPIKSSTQALLKSAITASWTAFECLATDIWVETLNARPIDLAQHVLTKIESNEQTDGINKRTIQVGLLAKHGFDLRSSMGTLLKQQFDFTGISGMNKAYTAAFGASVDMKNILDIEILQLLEAIRNLLVHRGGIIDETFQKRTKTHRKIDSELPINGKMVSICANNVIHSGYQLTNAVETWLNNNVSKS